MYSVYCEDQYLGTFDSYEEAKEIATENGKTGDFIGVLETEERDIFSYVYNTPDGDEQLDFIIYKPVTYSITA